MLQTVKRQQFTRRRAVGRQNRGSGADRRGGRHANARRARLGGRPGRLRRRFHRALALALALAPCPCPCPCPPCPLPLPLALALALDLDLDLDLDLALALDLARRPSPVTRHPSPAARGSRIADRRPPTADRRPPTADRRPPTADRKYRPTIPAALHYHQSTRRAMRAAAGGGAAETAATDDDDNRRAWPTAHDACQSRLAPARPFRQTADPAGLRRTPDRHAARIGRHTHLAPRGREGCSSSRMCRRTSSTCTTCSTTTRPRSRPSGTPC